MAREVNFRTKSETKSLSQLIHIRDVCHEGIVSKFSTKKYFTGNVLEIAEKIEEQIISELPSRLQETTDDMFKEAGVNDALLKLEELKTKKQGLAKPPWRYSGVPEDDTKRLLLSEEYRSLTSWQREFADKIQLDIQELKSILKHKRDELQKLEQEIEHELSTISKPVQLTNPVIT